MKQPKTHTHQRARLLPIVLGIALLAGGCAHDTAQTVPPIASVPSAHTQSTAPASGEIVYVLSYDRASASTILTSYNGSTMTPLAHRTVAVTGETALTTDSLGNVYVGSADNPTIWKFPNGNLSVAPSALHIGQGYGAYSLAAAGTTLYALGAGEQKAAEIAAFPSGATAPSSVAVTALKGCEPTTIVTNGFNIVGICAGAESLLVLSMSLQPVQLPNLTFHPPIAISSLAAWGENFLVGMKFNLPIDWGYIQAYGKDFVPFEGYPYGGAGVLNLPRPLQCKSKSDGVGYAQSVAGSQNEIFAITFDPACDGGPSSQLDTFLTPGAVDVNYPANAVTGVVVVGANGYGYAYANAQNVSGLYSIAPGATASSRFVLVGGQTPLNIAVWP